ncbi:MAG: TlpA family protein disulfide reductase [Rhodobacter sp.]|nr:TlpA family protein disulfide reductase [Rhodobacter sp.]
MSLPIGRRPLLAGLAAALVAGSAEARPPFRLRKDPQPLLSPPILGEDGTTRDLEDFAGRVILLNIWATWCPPCREEMPTLDRLEARLGGGDFAVLPLCIDAEGIGRGRQFYDEIGLANLPLYWADPMRVQLALAFIGLPTTLLIDRESREIGRLRGPFVWDSEEAVEQIVAAF